MEADAIRQELHTLLDQLPEAEVSRVQLYLRALVDPVYRSILSAPSDDEPESDGERAAVEAARGETGPGTEHKQVLREFGL